MPAIYFIELPMKPQILKRKTEKELIKIANRYQSVLEKEKRFHIILDNMKEGFQMIDFEWRYLYVNDTVIRQSKVKKKQLLGSKMTDLYPDFETTETFKKLQECMINREAKNFENKFTYPDQSTAWFELSVQPIEEGLFILSMDISERKKAEQDREQHIEEIEQLLFKISHEVRQPVCHIIGVSNMLDNSLITPEEFQKVVAYMKKSAVLLDTYTQELTDFVSDMKMNADEENNGEQH